MKNDYSFFGIAINGFLLQLSATRRELAEELGMTQAHLSRIIHNPELAPKSEGQIKKYVDALSGLWDKKDNDKEFRGDERSSPQKKQDFVQRARSELLCKAEEDKALIEYRKAKKKDSTMEVLNRLTGSDMGKILSECNGDPQKVVEALKEYVRTSPEFSEQVR